jgi:hypothetical protein
MYRENKFCSLCSMEMNVGELKARYIKDVKSLELR